MGEEGWFGRARVQAFWQDGSATYWLAPGAEIFAGRSSECELTIEHPSVSRRHARIRGGSPPSVEDLESANGVRVRGTRIAANVPVSVFPGDVIELGSAMVMVQAAPAVAAPQPPSADPAVGSAMDAVRRLLAVVATSELCVLLLGETGVGKTVAAERLHRASRRVAAPFVRVNCPSFPEALLESELFGHERGAFTGATSAKPGIFESAEGGTVFLDEIGEMPLATQAKLLGVVESREVLRLGSLKPRRIDVRFVAATNRDLEAQVASGAFRQDLYFRLNGLSVVIPPLRGRVPEVAPLARKFLEEACLRANRSPPVLSDDALLDLEQRPWPGNVRELRNAMERLAVLASDPIITPEHLVILGSAAIGQPSPPPLSRAGAETPTATPGLKQQLEAMERQRVFEALERCEGNQTRAAKLLGISRRALITRMEMYGLPRPRKKT